MWNKIYLLSNLFSINSHCINANVCVLSYYSHVQAAKQGSSAWPDILSTHSTRPIPLHGTQNGRAYLYGAEYQTQSLAANGPLRSVSNYNVPCAVCYTLTQRIVVMIPAQYTCQSSWTREHYGYLMANRDNYHCTMFECIDHSPQTVPDSKADTNGALFYHTEVKCGYGIPCPPYDAQKEVVCVACTK